MKSLATLQARLKLFEVLGGGTKIVFCLKNEIGKDQIFGISDIVFDNKKMCILLESNLKKDRIHFNNKEVIK